MKTKRINYKIEEPCHADWDQMKPETQGRFCESCSKSVIDFSTMSDFSIVNYLEKNKDQSVCGRFSEDQLNRTYLWTKPYQNSFHFDLKVVALGLALTTFSALPSQAQQPTPVVQTDLLIEPVSIRQGAVAVFYDHSDETQVSGKVTLSGNDYSTVKVLLMDGNSTQLASVKPSKTGTFHIPLDWTKNPVSIRVVASGYESETVYFSNHSSLKDLKISLSERRIVKGKVAPYTKED